MGEARDEGQIPLPQPLCLPQQFGSWVLGELPSPLEGGQGTHCMESFVGLDH